MRAKLYWQRVAASDTHANLATETELADQYMAVDYPNTPCIDEQLHWMGGGGQGEAHETSKLKSIEDKHNTKEHACTSPAGHTETGLN